MLRDLIAALRYSINWSRNDEENAIRHSTSLLPLFFILVVIVWIAYTTGIANGQDILNLIGFYTLYHTAEYTVLVRITTVMDHFTRGVFGIVGFGAILTILARIGGLSAGYRWFKSQRK